MKIAENVVIRHNCDCPTATQPMEGDESEHVFTIDGVEFPWAISERGPVVLKSDAGFYISVEIFVAGEPDARGVGMWDV